MPNASQTSDLDVALRAMISSLPPGTALPPQPDLRAKFGVTAYKLEKALHQLEHEGLVTIRRHKGVFTREAGRRQKPSVEILLLDRFQQPLPYENMLQGLMKAVGGQGIECHATRINVDDLSRLEDMLRQCAEDPSSMGAVITGLVTGKVARYLETVRQPFVIFMDVSTAEIWPSLPVVTPDAFQAGLICTDDLLARRCTHLVLPSVWGQDHWLWEREMCAGALESVERHGGVPIFIPEPPDRSGEPVPDQVERWLHGDAAARVGIFCRSSWWFHEALSIRERFLRLATPPEIALLGWDLRPGDIPGVHKFVCPTTELAEVAVRRLAAIRRGADSLGRHLVPFRKMSQKRRTRGILE